MALKTRLPFTTRSASIEIQSECPDLRRTRATLRQGTRPSRKFTNITYIKKYLNVCPIARYNIVIVKQQDPLLPSTELIVVPRHVLDGHVTALHIKLNHPSKYQMLLHFYALDLSKAVDRVCSSCHACVSLRKFPDTLVIR